MNPARWHMALGAGAALAMALAVSAQPPTDPQKPGVGTPSREPRSREGRGSEGHDGQQPGTGRERTGAFDDPQTARSMLARWLEDMDKRRPVFIEAIRRLDAGEAVEKVRVYVRENSPPLVRFGPMSSGREYDSLIGPTGAKGSGREAGPESVGPATPDEREAIREILAARDPSASEQLARAEREGKPEVEAIYADGKRRLRWWIELRKNDRQMYDVRLKDLEWDRKAHLIAGAFVEQENAATPDAAKLTSLKQDLRKAVAMRYNMRYAVLALELVRFEERLTKTRKDIQDGASNSDRIIDTETDEMIRAVRDGKHEGAPKKNRPETTANSDSPSPARHAPARQPAPAPDPGS